MTVFLRAIESDDKAELLRASGSGGETAAGTTYVVSHRTLSGVPGSPFTYWVPSGLRSVYSRFGPFGVAGRDARHGAATLDDVRFVRIWYEAGTTNWAPLAKGGGQARYYSDIHLAIQWAGDAAELKAYASALRMRKGWGDQWTAVLNGWSFYFRPGATWPHRSARFTAAAMPSGCVFTQSGKAAFTDLDDLPAYLALFNSAVVTLLFRVLSDQVRIKFEVGLVKQLPIPLLTASENRRLAVLFDRAWSIKRSLDTRTETSHAFVLPGVLQVEGGTLSTRTTAWSERVREAEAELECIQAEIDERCFELYGISDEDRRAITEDFGGASGGDEELAEDVEEEDATDGADPAILAAELVSWAVGVTFGRFDVRLATDQRALPDEPDPFDPLPVCSAAMLTGENGLPLSTPPNSYPIDFPQDGVLVDDPGHPRDLYSAVRHVFEVVFGERADALLAEAAALLDSKKADLRVWLAKNFFEFHLKRHSKSRRKAPILWQLATPSSRYSVWLYAHRIDSDSLFRLRADVIEPKLATEERKLAALLQDAGPAPTTSQGKAIAEQEAFVEELRTMREEVARVAPLWNLDLDDGIVIAMSPLWRLVPQHRAWQKELKTTFESLGAGKYDWAHLAMHLWPERVVPKCASDRSLAIAHGLEDVFWIEGEDNKWTQRTVGQDAIDELVAQRTSPAVADALRSMLEAPVATGGRVRRMQAGGTT